MIIAQSAMIDSIFKIPDSRLKIAGTFLLILNL